MMTYSVIRSHRGLPNDVWSKSVATGLSLEAARSLEHELTAAEVKAKPTQTSWTRDIFYIELEGGDAINADLQRKRMERCSISTKKVS